MRLRWTRPAKNDLVELRKFIAEEDETAAGRTGRRIRAAAKLLETTPQLGHPGRIPETRELIVPRTRYILAYRVRRGQVEVLRVLHSSRRWPRALH